MLDIFDFLPKHRQQELAEARVTSCSVEGCEKRVNSHGLCGAHDARRRRHGDPLAGGTNHGAPERFLDEVVLADHGGRPDVCIGWHFATDAYGYARIRVDGSAFLAHRIVCEAVHGPARSPEYEAAHSCGNGHLGCIAPGHVSWKTRSGNQMDRVLHGTSNRGESHGLSKLTEADVCEIRSLAGTKTQAAIAARYGVSQSAVSRIVRRKDWAWLGAVPPLAEAV